MDGRTAKAAASIIIDKLKRCITNAPMHPNREHSVREARDAGNRMAESRCTRCTRVCRCGHALCMRALRGGPNDSPPLRFGLWIYSAALREGCTEAM